MTALTMPTCAVAFMSGHAYPFRSDLAGESATLLAQVPQLPDGFHWATGAEVHEACTRLDVATVALLLYAAGLDPMACDDTTVITACHSELCASHGDTRRARTVFALDVEREAEGSNACMRACTVRAARLLAVA
jgi:hypothetical protein